MEVIGSIPAQRRSSSPLMQQSSGGDGSSATAAGGADILRVSTPSPASSPRALSGPSRSGTVSSSATPASLGVVGSNGAVKAGNGVATASSSSAQQEQTPHRAPSPTTTSAATRSPRLTPTPTAASRPASRSNGFYAAADASTISAVVAAANPPPPPLPLSSSGAGPEDQQPSPPLIAGGSNNNGNSSNTVPIASYQPSIQEVGQWVAGSRYMRYDIERPRSFSPTTAAAGAGGRVGSAAAGGGVNSKKASRMTSRRTFNTIGVGITLSAAPHHQQQQSSSPTTSAATTDGTPNNTINDNAPQQVGNSIIDGANNTTYSSTTRRPSLATSVGGPSPYILAAPPLTLGAVTTSTSTSKPLPSVATGNTTAAAIARRDAAAMAARSRLLHRRDELQASLDARGSQYVNKVGKLTSAWLFGEDRKAPRKGPTPNRHERGGSPSPPTSPSGNRSLNATQRSLMGSLSTSTSAAVAALGAANSAKASSISAANAISLEGTTPTTAPLVGGGVSGGIASLEQTRSVPLKSLDLSATRNAAADAPQPPPSLIRQHLGSSFAAVHLSPNSSTVIVYSPTQSPRAGTAAGGGGRSSRGGAPRSGRVGNGSGDASLSSTVNQNPSPAADADGDGGGGVTSLGSTLNGTAATSALSSTRVTSPRSAGGAAKGFHDIGANPPTVMLKRSTSPPLSPIHGGCTHNEQQQPRLFPALLGPFQNPNYYCRKDGATVGKLQEQRDNRPSSPMRHGNAQGVPSIGHHYLNDHDVTLDAPFRVCGSETHQPMPRQRPAAGPPQFLSPGTTAAAKRTYLGMNPMAYQN